MHKLPNLHICKCQGQRSNLAIFFKKSLIFKGFRLLKQSKSIIFLCLHVSEDTLNKISKVNKKILNRGFHGNEMFDKIGQFSSKLPERCQSHQFRKKIATRMKPVGMCSLRSQ